MAQSLYSTQRSTSLYQQQKTFLSLRCLRSSCCSVLSFVIRCIFWLYVGEEYQWIASDSVLRPISATLSWSVMSCVSVSRMLMGVPRIRRRGEVKWRSQWRSIIRNSNSEFSVVQFHFTEIRSTGLLVDCKMWTTVVIVMHWLHCGGTHLWV